MAIIVVLADLLRTTLESLADLLSGLQSELLSAHLSVLLWDLLSNLRSVTTTIVLLP